MFGKKAPRSKSLRFDTQEELFRHLEAEVRQKMVKKAVKMGFWGSLSVDPNEVYISKEQADRSLRALENSFPGVKARREEKRMQDEISKEGPATPRPGKGRL